MIPHCTAYLLTLLTLTSASHPVSADPTTAGSHARIGRDLPSFADWLLQLALDLLRGLEEFILGLPTVEEVARFSVELLEILQGVFRV